MDWLNLLTGGGSLTWIAVAGVAILAWSNRDKILPLIQSLWAKLPGLKVPPPVDTGASKGTDRRSTLDAASVLYDALQEAKAPPEIVKSLGETLLFLMGASK